MSQSSDVPAPPARELYVRRSFEQSWFDWIDARQLYVECPANECDGGGVLCATCGGDTTVPHDECGGKGCLLCQQEGTEECAGCRGKGDVPCATCLGHGKVPFTVVPVRAASNRPSSWHVAWLEARDALDQADSPAEHHALLGWSLGMAAACDADHGDTAALVLTHVLAGRMDVARRLIDARIAATMQTQRDAVAELAGRCGP